MENLKVLKVAVASVFSILTASAWASSEVVFLPQFPMHPSLPGLMAGSMVSFSGDAAIEAFDFLVKSKNPVRTVPYDSKYPAGTGYQTVDSTQLSCLRNFRENGTIQSTHCATHLNSGAGLQAWGPLRSDDDEYLDNGFGTRGAASIQRMNSSVVAKRLSPNKLQITVSGAAGLALREAKFSTSVVQCSAKGICVLTVSGK